MGRSLPSLKPETVYHYRLMATNSAGKTAYGADKEFKTTNPPETTITSKPPTYTSNEDVSIQFAADQGSSTFKCWIDKEAAKACTSPFTLPAHPGEGWHSFNVVASNAKGEDDKSAAQYAFNPAIYPPAPSTSKLVYPESGKKTADYYTLEAEWGKAPDGIGVTGVTFQMKMDGFSKEVFKDVPAECTVDGQGKEVSWPLPATNNQGHSDPVFLKVRDCPAFYYGSNNNRSAQFRAVYDGSKEAAGASESVSTEFVWRRNATRVPTDATEAIGPVSLDLLTGAFTVSRTDVSIPVPGTEANLEFTRVYNSSEADNEPRPMGYWLPSMPVEAEYEGSAWQGLYEEVIPATPVVFEKECWNEKEETIACGAGCPEGSCEEWEAEEAQPEERWMELRDNEGGGISFEIQGSSFVSPDYAKELVLAREGENIVLSTPEGTHTPKLAAANTRSGRSPSRRRRAPSAWSTKPKSGFGGSSLPLPRT